ncbi:MAG: hypothetical protein J7L20_03765 [Thermoplasmata archaeon]|nr:hypothetical protein [Thermoplasmata archaeon]
MPEHICEICGKPAKYCVTLDGEPWLWYCEGHGRIIKQVFEGKAGISSRPNRRKLEEPEPRMRVIMHRIVTYLSKSRGLKRRDILCLLELDGFYVTEDEVVSALRYLKTLGVIFYSQGRYYLR